MRELKRAIACFDTFLKMARPEGRKVCQAWFEMALCKFLLVSDASSRKNLESACGGAARGFAAEEQMLPFLRKHEAQTEDSSAKKMCNDLLACEEGLGWDNVQRSVPKRRKQANELFKNGNYEHSIEAYSKLLEVLPQEDKAKILSNRSAAYEKLQDYHAAETDALEVIRLKPDWLKGYAPSARAFEHVRRSRSPRRARRSFETTFER